MKKWLSCFLVVFAIYTILIYLYIFHWSSSEIPGILKGTASDPTTFMNAKELEQSVKYAQIRNFMFFVVTPLQWLFYLFLLSSGISKNLETWSQQKRRGLRIASFVFSVSLISFIIFLPLNFYSYRLSTLYHLSTQTIPSWLKDSLISFVLDFGITCITASAVFGLIHRFRRNWWFYTWLVSVPFTLFMIFIQPVVIDPLYNDFYPLKDKALEQKILALAEKANIPADHVFEVNMSEKTNTLNAYVTGIGDNSRIVLWDTTLNKLNDDEILFVMAHEMAHYVEKDVYQSVAIYLAASFLGLWIINQFLNWYIARKNNILHLSSLKDFSLLPAILLMISILSFAFSPLENTYSRMQEARADQYALEMTGDAESGITAFQKLSTYGLSQVNPPELVKIFRYTHPTMMERIQTFEKYEKDKYK